MTDDLIQRLRELANAKTLHSASVATIVSALREAADALEALQSRLRELLFQLSFWEARTDSHTAAFSNELMAKREEWLRCLVDIEIRRRAATQERWQPCGHDDPSWCTDKCVPPWKRAQEQKRD